MRPSFPAMRLSFAAINVRLALRAIRTNKLRAALTMLGVIIGVSSVIAMVSIGDGAQARVTSQVAKLGTNLLQVNARPPRVGGVAQQAGASSNLTLSDATALRGLPGIAAVAPEMNHPFQVTYQRRNSNLQVDGTTEEYARVRSWPLASGRFLSAQDVSKGTLVAVLGSTAASDLFGIADPLGKTIQVDSTVSSSSSSSSSGSHTITLRLNLAVVGVLRAKGLGGPQNSDDRVFVPISTARWRLIGSPNLRSIDVQASSSRQMSNVASEIKTTLDRLHQIANANQSPYHVQNQADVLATAQGITGTFTLLLAAIAAMSLVVGGIGIMNIMMVSVTERTREIGIRKALGATSQVVLQQFLFEAVVLSLMGGLIGVGLGTGIAQGLSMFAGWATLVSMKAVALAFGFALAMGLIFGVYPAWRGAHLNPIEALRYE
ncbi:MAG: ABC transporter permease [Chloroflexota bacterium]